MEVAKELLKKLKKIYRTKKGIIVIGDKAYDTKDIFNFVVLNLRGAAIIPENMRKLYKKRQSVELYFARLQALRVEIPLFFNQRSIANATTIAHLALSAVALAAVALDRPHKIRSYRTFPH